MSEFIMIGRKVATTSSEPVKEQPAPVQIAPDESASVETEVDLEADEIVVEEGIAEDSIEGNVDNVNIDPVLEEGNSIDPGFVDGGYIDPGFYEGGYIDPGMEMGMGEVKEPFLSSWPNVIGISAAIFVVSIALGALLARLKIKKGIDLYED